MSSEFICPVTQTDCRFYHFCASKEEQIAGVSGEDKAAQRFRNVVPEVGAAFIGSHCVAETMNALLEIADYSENSRERAIAQLTLTFLDQAVGLFEGTSRQK